jgi:hypothetical protein
MLKIQIFLKHHPHSQYREEKNPKYDNYGIILPKIYIHTACTVDVNCDVRPLPRFNNETDSESRGNQEFELQLYSKLNSLQCSLRSQKT